MLPFYARYNDRSTASLIGTDLRLLANAIIEYRDDIGALPPNVSALIIAPTASSTNLCAIPLTVMERSTWNGPYLGQDLVTTQLVMGIDTLSNTFTRTPVGAASRTASGTLEIAVFNTSAQRAAMVDLLLDGNGTATSGPIIWGTVGPRPQMTYRVNVAGC